MDSAILEFLANDRPTECEEFPCEGCNRCAGAEDEDTAAALDYAAKYPI